MQLPKPSRPAVLCCAVLHCLSQSVIDGNKVILNRPGPDAKVEDVEFEPNEVYAIDMVVSSGEHCCDIRLPDIRMQSSKAALAQRKWQGLLQQLGTWGAAEHKAAEQQGSWCASRGMLTAVVGTRTQIWEPGGVEQQGQWQALGDWRHCQVH